MKVDPRQLEMLYAIVEKGGLSEGAEMLGKSQPSLSRSLSLLEQRIDTPLFEKDRRPLRPTELGLALAAEGRKIYEAGRISTEVLAQYRDGRSGGVRVGGTPFFFDGVVSGMLASFQFERPDVRIDQIYGYMNDLLPKLLDGSLDLAVLPMRDSSIPEDLEFNQILPGRNVIACRAGHPLVRRGSVTLADIVQYPWISPPAGSPLYQDLRAVLQEIGIKNFKVSFAGGSLSATVNILTGSDALTVLPFSVVFMMRNQRSVSALPIKIGDSDRHLGILKLRGQKMKPAAQKVYAHIRHEFDVLASSITRVSQATVWRP
ncbi:LysR family transcriptional regulator [Tropicibacter sp. R16_0]|uniref:LysR family transcriptional regulator n=1 Tax=Tropicibacter sp. R16_0 TaxID=2821102 RepID=UPI001ADD1CA2|nr:LysR family transcriptional regulator [Tropicibacter sp. R16_0]MBO9452945.1 LysR family transcriptional regulator [Tropicibacter sp. R16_0]